MNELKLLGTGTQGKVYRIDNERCIKIFKSKKDCCEEIKTLMTAQGDMHFPKLYSCGDDYIIREFIDGVELDNYLLKEKLTPEIIEKLICLYEAMIKVGYCRLDTAIFHIFVTPLSELKLIDTSKALKRKTIIPSLLISGLERLGYKADLFNFLKLNRPDLYKTWINYKKINYKKMS